MVVLVRLIVLIILGVHEYILLCKIRVKQSNRLSGKLNNGVRFNQSRAAQQHKGKREDNLLGSVPLDLLRSPAADEFLAIGNPIGTNFSLAIFDCSTIRLAEIINPIGIRL